jgi:hypothetical protein
VLFLAGKLFAQAGADRFTIDPEPDPKDLRAFVELARADVKAQKALILAQNMEFTQDEAVDFWPLYGEYAHEFTKLLDLRLDLIKHYADVHKAMTDADASKLAKDSLSIEEKRTALKRKYFKKFTKVVGAKKAARFFQIENQINTAIDLRISASLPLIK